MWYYKNCNTVIKGDTTIAFDDKGGKNAKDKVLYNDRIRSKEVRLIDDKGNNHGVVSTRDALKMAEDANLDLVIVSPNQEPPVLSFVI